MELPKQFWMSYFVFLEEAHKLCGEQDKQESASAVKDLMSRGRKMGYCGVLITQRIAKLHKDAAAECNNKFIGRTNLDIDMDRAAKELGFSGSSTYTRLSLRTGDKSMTYDTSRPQPPKAPIQDTKSPVAWAIGSVVVVLLIGMAIWGVFGSGPTPNNPASTVTPNTNTGSTPK